jgi:hypothetical protein
MGAAGVVGAAGAVVAAGVAEAEVEGVQRLECGGGDCSVLRPLPRLGAGKSTSSYKYNACAPSAAAALHPWSAPPR